MATSHTAREHQDGEAPARTPRLLLWSTGIAAVLLGGAAFLLWGINGPSTLFDMIVAYCF